MDYTKAFHVASGFFLVERIPEEIINRSLNTDTEEEILQFIKDNLWAPFEYMEPSIVLTYITNAAEDIVYYSND